MSTSTDPPMNSPAAATDTAPMPMLALRSVIGGVLMGLANLVPGISGGTMLLAAGVYPRFINAIGEVTTFKFRQRSILTLVCVVVAAVLAIAIFAGPVKDLVVHQRWIMYSLFIGLTLGGVPVVWRLIGKASGGVWLGAIVGFVGMAALALAQASGGGGVDREGFLLMLLAGAAGASAMILPGVSGGYLLLVLGVYVPLLAAISGFKDALSARDMDAVFGIGLGVILPVGLGVVLGVVLISNLLRWLLKACEKPTLGVLLGLLLGAVVGLWPFQQGEPPVLGQTLKGQSVAINAEGELYFEPTGKPVEPEDYPTAFFTPTPGQIGGSAALIVAGFAVTMVVDLIGKDKKSAKPQPD